MITKRTHSNIEEQVICVSRRTDLPGNKEQLKNFLESLKSGSIIYPFPFLARNPQCKRTCECSLKPEAVIAISWWSKDFRHLISMWNNYENILKKYHHHFSFTINGPNNSILEPGVISTLEERYQQIEWLTKKCCELGQDPNRSIMIHLDPIIIYTSKRIDISKVSKSSLSNTFPNKNDNLAHLPAMTNIMRTNGLKRIHFSFMQFSWQRVRSRLKKYGKDLVIYNPSIEEKIALFEEKVIPYVGDIILQTCTAIDIIDYYATHRNNSVIVIRNACVGYFDIKTISFTKDVPCRKQKKTNDSDSRKCLCYPFKDVGTQQDVCTHGCRYCFMNPNIYEF